MPNLNPFAALRSEKDRRWRRHHVDIALRVRAWRGGAFETVAGRGSDVSEGGMAVSVPTALQMGETVTLQLTLPGSDLPLMLTGVVRNLQSDTYGMEFVGLRDQQREAIVRLCEALEKAQPA